MPSRSERLDEFLQALALVEASPNYRVLRRLVAQEEYEPWRGERCFTGLALDLETTSPDPATCEVIEFGAVRFTFDAAGTIHDIGDRYNEFQQPSKPIEPIITEITGITDADVEGQKISTPRVAELASGVDLFLAFNSDFDRRVAERHWMGLFNTTPWACAMRQVPWPRYDVVGGKLQHVATAAGYFYDAHRALDDCLAMLHLLATMRRPCDACGGFGGAANIDPVQWSCFVCRGSTMIGPMQEILATTRSGAVRVLAHGSPIEWKDQLKARGYQWRGRRPWFIDRPTRDDAEAEAEWLRANIPHTRPGFTRIGARDRYSVREDALTFEPVDDYRDYSGNPYA